MAVSEAGRRELFSRYMTEEYGVTVNEIMAGLALVALGILSLAHVSPVVLDAINVIIAGVALMIISGGLALELEKAMGQEGGGEVGLNAGVMGAVAGIVLGILALLHVRPVDLVSIAVIIYGGAVLFNYLASVQIRTLARVMAIERSEGSSSRSAGMTTSSALGNSTIALIAGTGLLTLGILALVGIVRVDLVAIALLGLGAFLFLAASSVMNRLLFQTQ